MDYHEDMKINNHFVFNNAIKVNLYYTKI